MNLGCDGLFDTGCHQRMTKAELIAMAVTHNEYKKEKATSPEKSDLIEIWRPLPDLNRCRRRERAVSWAGLDEGDVFSGEPRWDRTNDHLIKSQVLYLLS